jgi:nucleotide-binding universal stress UspA family protein
MPLLVRADQVTVLIVTQGARVADAGPLPRRLRQAGVTATVHRVEAGGAGIGAALIAEAHRVDADLLVMGARGRGRTAHHGLAGATREVLALADLPVLLRH